MRSPLVWNLILLLSIGLVPTVSAGQAPQIERKHDAWGRFRPGAWKLVRVINETFEEQGALLRSIAQMKTTLKGVAEDGVTLQTEVSIEVGGKQFDPQPQTVKQALIGEAPSEDVKVTELGTGQLTIQGRQIPCRIRQLEFAGPNGKTVTTIYFSDSVAPYVLKRQSKKTDPEGKTLSETTVDVLDLDLPFVVLGAIRKAAQLRTVHKHPSGTTTTLAIVSVDVPGGIVCQDRKETDDSGRLVARISLQLMGYGLEPEEEEDRGGFFRRRRGGRDRKSQRLYVP